MHVVNVIEPQIQQLLAVLVQRDSFTAHHQDVEYFLVIIDRDSNSTQPFQHIAEQLNFRCRSAEPVGQNPFMNKWAWLQAFPELQQSDQVALCDWDIVCTAAANWPELTPGTVAARKNPVDMYRWRCRSNPTIQRLRGVTDEGDIPTSVNSGVLIAAGADLCRLTQRQFEVFQDLNAAEPVAPDWEFEQLAASLAIGSVGWQPLEDRWNVTPTSPVDDDDVVLWHYNDGNEHTWRMKRDLLSDSVVRTCMDALRPRWPQTMARHWHIYEKAVLSPVFQPFRK
ncbi:MAG: hypothetical protein KDA96_08295 [Planctomycetaceae bacterium]|nr:hypothetical protein [Planctomycetaceae bacterium]